MNQMFIDAVPVPLCLALILFAIFPMWQASIVVVAAFAYAAFDRWNAKHKSDELLKIHDEMKMLKAQVEAVQLSRTLHHR